MAFHRKWVSDSNLDKLWHETVEKKEANKQRRSPDFCKEAILSATLKRISSEMVMRRLSTPNCDRSLERSPNSLTLISRVKCEAEYDFEDGLSITTMSCDDFADEEFISTEKENTLPLSDEFSAKTESLDMDRDLQNSHVGDFSMVLSVPESPKRKWHDSDEDKTASLDCTDPHSLSCSPAKRQRCRQAKSQQQSNFKTKRSKSLTRTTCKAHIKQNLLDSSELESSHTTSLPIPVKSVVNSISALSLSVGGSPGRSWVIPSKEATHKDPLELDDFFSKLKKVSS